MIRDAKVQLGSKGSLKEIAKNGLEIFDLYQTLC